MPHKRNDHGIGSIDALLLRQREQWLTGGAITDMYRGQFLLSSGDKWLSHIRYAPATPSFEQNHSIVSEMIGETKSSRQDGKVEMERWGRGKVGQSELARFLGQ